MISIVVAATAVTACALVAIAWMLGWLPAHASARKAAAPASVAASGTAAGGELALLPGESIVSADEAAKVAPGAARAPAGAPKPVAPQYSSAKPPEPAPRRAAPAPQTAMQAEPAPRTATRPASPSHQRAPTSFERSARNVCVNCGTVTSITSFEMGEWDVKVRFEDGSTETLRYRTRPPLRIGQGVLLEDGRLIPQ